MIRAYNEGALEAVLKIWLSPFFWAHHFIPVGFWSLIFFSSHDLR